MFTPKDCVDFMTYADGGYGVLTAMEICERLLTAYGRPQWWSENPYMVMIQAVLVQNTAWSSVTKVTNSIADLLIPQQVRAMTAEALEDLIRPCGFCRAKAATIHRLTEWFALYGYNVNEMRRIEKTRLRKELLAIKGIGEETADVVLVYALHKSSFVIDAYTRRFIQRLQGVPSDDHTLRDFSKRDCPRMNSFMAGITG